MGAGEALRRVLECLAYGILMAGKPTHSYRENSGSQELSGNQSLFFFAQIFHFTSHLCVSDGSGICDPCEKELTDAIGHMDRQQREDITQSAQVRLHSCVALKAYLISWHLTVPRSRSCQLSTIFNM